MKPIICNWQLFPISGDEAQDKRRRVDKQRKERRMDGGQHQSQFSHSTTSSSSSAIDLTGTGLSVPQLPSSETNRTRRRTSWGKVDAGLDPVHLSLPSVEAGPSNLGRKASPPRELQHSFEDPFYSPADHAHSIRGEYQSRPQSATCV